jgi:hypothetical protein
MPIPNAIKNSIPNNSDMYVLFDVLFILYIESSNLILND